jgi:hypothetical protein
LAAWKVLLFSLAESQLKKRKQLSGDEWSMTEVATPGTTTAMLASDADSGIVPDKQPTPVQHTWTEQSQQA